MKRSVGSLVSPPTRAPIGRAPSRAALSIERQVETWGRALAANRPTKPNLGERGHNIAK